MTSPRPVQELSMQWIDIARAIRYLNNEKITAKTSLSKLICCIVKKYNETHITGNDGFQYCESSSKQANFFSSKGFGLRIYARNISANPNLRRVIVKKATSQKINKKKGTETLLFFTRQDPREITVLSSGQAWNVVRPCIHFEYPIKIAERILDPDQIIRIQRSCLIGPGLRETIICPPSGELYKTANLYYLIDSIQCVVKKNASLRNDFPDEAKLTINITSGGVLRIQKKLPLEAYPEIIKLFYQYTHDQETYSSEGKIERRDPQFEFLHFLQPAQIGKRLLDKQIAKQAFDFYNEPEKGQPVFFRHKFLNDYLNSTHFEIQQGTSFHHFSDSPPTLSEVIESIGARITAKILFNEMQSKKLRYKHPYTNQFISTLLIDCLEGEVRYEEQAYFKMRGMWYQLSADFNALLREDFKSLLRNVLIESGTEGHLPLPWKGNTRQDVLSEKQIKNATGISRGIREFMKGLPKTKVCFVSATEVNQKILVGEILDQEIISKNKEKIEKILSETPREALDKQLKQEFPQDFVQILAELEEQRFILGPLDKALKKYPVLNPFAYPLKDKCKGKIDALETLLRDLYDKRGTQDEGAYNRSYLYDQMNKGTLFNAEEGYLVFDCILPNNIEPCDIIRYTKKTVYLYHVKEDFGQHTRDACSQVLNSAKLLRSALSTHQPKNFLQMLWEEGTVGEKKGWRKQIKEQLLHLGKQKFLNIFHNRKIVIVYAFLEGTTRSLRDEVHIPTRLSPTHLQGPSQKEKFQELKDEHYLDSNNRLTGKFYESSQNTFKLKTFEKENADIYAQLSQFRSVSASTLAKLELIHAARELQGLNFDFRICEIQRPEHSQQTPGFPSIDDSGDSSSVSDDMDSPKLQTRGLKNVGNSCYINATLQVLFSIPELSDLVIEKKEDFPSLFNVHQMRKASALLKLRQTVFEQRGKGVLTGAITRQQDAHEFLVFILDQLGWRPIETYSNFFYRSPSGKNKKHEGPSEGFTNHLSLGINGDFQTSLNAYFAKEALVEKRVIKFEGKTYLVKQYKALRIKGLPNILVVHLNRFNPYMEKITTEVAFPDNGIVTLQQSRNDTATSYQIFAYINHHGEMMHSGHYTADIMNLNAEGEECWTRYDDEKVYLPSELKPETDAYVVFLKKADDELLT